MNNTDVLYQNCRNFTDWPRPICVVGNIGGLVSAAIWFLVLLPQVIKNFRLRSVVGLSFLWAVANFTASLINLFFVFHHDLPLYVKIEAVYMPCLEFTILVQFLLFSKAHARKRLLCLLVCLLVWSCVLTIELAVRKAPDYLFWAAIFLWSIETFPQVVLNMQRRSTSGQSTISIGLTLVGKATDYISTYALNMPIQFVIMCYFSSSSAYINGFQVFWYGMKKAKKRAVNSFREVKNLLAYVCPRCADRFHDDCDGSDGKKPLYVSSSEQLNVTADDFSDHDHSVNDDGTSELVQKSNEGDDGADEERTLPLTPGRVVGLVYVSIVLIAFAVGFVANMGHWWAAFGPVIILGILAAAYAYRQQKERKSIFKRLFYTVDVY